MSDTNEQDHTGPIKTPRQMLWVSIAAFVVPVFIIIGLVYFVTSTYKPSGSNQTELLAGSGVTDQARDRAVSERLQKVGSVAIADANRPLKSGEEVYKAQCVACHGSGALGAPKLGDVAGWAARVKTGYEALLNSALKGKNAMQPQGGGDFSDVEIGRAVVYMANNAGAKFEEPKAPAAAAAASAAK